MKLFAKMSNGLLLEAGTVNAALPNMTSLGGASLQLSQQYTGGFTYESWNYRCGSYRKK